MRPDEILQQIRIMDKNNEVVKNEPKADNLYNNEDHVENGNS